jgi:hypothetical protein
MDGSSPSGGPPPPPSAAQVLAEDRERKRAIKRENSPPTTHSPAYSPAGSPSPETVGLHARVLEKVVGTLKHNGGSMNVKVLVDGVKPMFVGAEERAEMKSVLKSVLKKVADMDKSQGVVELKMSYR